MANRVVQWYRGQNPNDTRSDDELTLELAVQYPETFTTYPDAMADFERIRKDLLKAQVTPTDYIKQAAGSAVRGVAGVVASVPEAAGELVAGLANKIEEAAGPKLGDPDKQIEEYTTYKAGQKAGEVIRKIGDAIAPEPVEALDESFWATKVPQGLGSAAGFMAGGAASKLLKIPQTLGIAGLGALSSGADAWKEAKAAGASDDEAYKVFLLNAGVGTSEVLPLSKMLKRLDGVTGNTFTKTLVEAGKETFEEALQEAAQQFGNNYIAKKTYDKDRDLLKDLATNAEVGGVTGALFSLITQAIGGKVGKLKTSASTEDTGKTTQTTTGSNVRTGTKMPVQPNKATESAKAGVATDIDVRENFVTDDDKAAATRLAQLQADGKTGPEVDALSADVGARIKTAPALLAFYSGELDRLRQITTTKTEEESKPSETSASELIQGLVDEANARFEKKRKEQEDLAAQQKRDAEAQDAIGNALDEAAAKGGESNGQKEIQGQQEVLKAQQLAAARTAAANVDTEAAASEESANAPRAAQPSPVVRSAAPTTVREVAAVVKPEVWQKLLPQNGIEDVISKVIEQKAAVTSGVGGQGQKAARLFEETNSTTELYKDSKATGENRTMSRKLAVLVSPDGSHVVIGTAYRNASGGKLQDMVMAYDNKGKAKAVRLNDLAQAGWELVGSIKTDEPTKGYVATHSIEQWQALKADLNNLRSGQANTASKMESVIAQGKEFGRTDRGDEGPSGDDVVEAAQTLTDASTGEDVALADAATINEEEKVKGFGPAEGRAIFDAIQGKTRDELSDAETMLNALASSKRAMHSIGRLIKVLVKAGAIDTNDQDSASAVVHQLIYEASIQAQRDDFAKSLLSSVRAAGGGSAQEGGAGRANAGAGGQPGAGSAGSQGTQTGTNPGSKAEEVAQAAAVTNPNPTEAEKKSGDYQKGVVTLLDGLDVVIENAQGSERSKEGKWSVTMPVHYGYVKGTEGKDGDEVDVFIGEHPESGKVWVVDQINPKTKKFDEHKALVGFETKEQALAAYDASFSDKSGPSRTGAVVEMDAREFVDWVNEGDTKAALAYGKRVRHRQSSLGNEFRYVVSPTSKSIHDVADAFKLRVVHFQKDNKFMFAPKEHKFVVGEAVFFNLNGEQIQGVVKKIGGDKFVLTSVTNLKEFTVKKSLIAPINAVELQPRQHASAEHEAYVALPNGIEDMPKLSKKTWAIDSLNRLAEEGWNSAPEEVDRGMDLSALSAQEQREVAAELEYGIPRAFAKRVGFASKEDRLTSAAYQAAYAWAHNNGYMIVPDVSTTMSGNYRRNAHQLSSAIRYESAEHFLPTADQLGMMEISEAKWVQLSYEDKVRMLQKAEVGYMEELLPDLQRFTYDPIADNIVEEGADGESIEMDWQDFFDTIKALKEDRLLQLELDGKNEDLWKAASRIGKASLKRYLIEKAGLLGRFDGGGLGTHPYLYRDGRPSPETTRQTAAAFRAAIEKLVSMGADGGVLLKLLSGVGQEYGRYSEQIGRKGFVRSITLAVADAANPTVDNLIMLLHELGHGVFSADTQARQAMMERAISGVADDVLGITDFKISKNYTTEEAQSAQAEERLVEAVARRLAYEGFNPAESGGFAQALIRLLKDLYHRAVMLAAKAFGADISADRAQAYMANRIKAVLSGDAQIGLIDFLGGPKLSPLEQIEQRDPVAYAEMVVGRVRYSGNNLRFVDNPREPVTPDLNSSELKKPQVAAQNFIQSVLADAFEAFKREGLNTMGYTLESFLKNPTFIQLPEKIGDVEHYPNGELPADLVAEINKQLAAIGQPTIPPDFKLEDVSDTVRKRAAAQAHRVLRSMVVDMAEKRRLNERDAKEKFERLQSQNRELSELMANYEDLELVTSIAQPRLLGLVEELRKAALTIESDGHKAGVLEQVIAELDGKIGRKGVTQYEKALNAISKKLDGSKLADLLDAVATLGIDWNTMSATDIRAAIFAAGNKELYPLIQITPESKALLAGVIAFSKSNGHVMDLLSLRREKAFEERKIINEALSLAVSSHSTAINEARELLKAHSSMVALEKDAAGRVVNINFTRIGKKAFRVLSRIEQLKRENRELLDEAQREGAFNQWHEATRPVFRSRLAELERMIGIQYQDWQLVDEATYPVPPNPNSRIEHVLANQKKVDLSNIGSLRADMMKLREWLDNVPEGDRGADWVDMDSIYKKVAYSDITRGHEAVRQNLLMRHLAPLPDRLRFIGTPVARVLASRIYTMQAMLRKFTSFIQTRGENWEAAEAKAMKAVGVTQQDVFRRKIYQPMMGWLEKHMDLLAAQKDAKTAEDVAVRGVMEYLALDPDTAPLLAKSSKSRAALEKYLRLTAQNAAWTAENGRELGNKVLDESGNYKVYRDVIGQTPYTVMRSFSELGEQVFNLMRNSLWANKKLQRDAAVEVYRSDPAAAAAALQPYVTPEIWNTFARRWAYREGRSSFYAPRHEDGIQVFARRDNVIKAFENAKGDLIKFAETLYALEGGKTDLAEFVGDTLEQWQANYNMIEVLHQDPSTSPDSMLPKTGPRRFIADSRKSEELPREFLDYLPYDTFTLRQITKGQVYQASFGRNLEAWANNLHSAKVEQKKMAAAYRSLEAYYRDKGLTGKQLKAAMQAEVTGGWKNIPGVDDVARKANYLALEQAADNLYSLNVIGESFESLLTMNRMRPPEFRVWNNLLGTLAGATVSGPATALTDNISTVEQPFRKLGFDWQAVQWVLGTKKTEMALAANSLLQAFGLTLSKDAAHVRLLNELGIVDDDATISLKDKAAAYFLEEHNLVNSKAERAAWNISQSLRLFLGTGIGRAKSGAPIYPTFKPHSPFLWGAQITHMASTLQWWRTYESLVGAAVRHFEANPADLSNPEFRFSQSQIADLGFKSGWRAWEFLTTRLADYGLGGLEQVARDAAVRRAKNPKAALLSRDAYAKLAQLAQNEITLDSGLATRHPFLVTNDKGALINPLMGWALNKSYDFAVGFRGPDGSRTLAGTRTAIVAMLFGVLPAALAYALMRDLYDEYVMKRKANVRDLRSVTSPQDALLTLMDNVSRVGAMGMAGEMLNSNINFDSARPVSLDSRIFIVSSALSLGKSVAGLAMQGGAADWATVYRPMFSALGGSGYLQYADAINGVLGLDNQEARVARRVAVSNYLRAAGRELSLDVRKSGATSASLPSEQKMYVGQMVMAALANDHAAFNDAYRNAKKAAKDAGSDDPEQTIQRSFSAYSPLRLVFQTEPTEQEYRRMLMSMSELGRDSVASAIRLFNHYGEQIGVKPNLGRKEKKTSLFDVTRQKPTLNDLRRQAAMVGAVDF